MNRCGGQILRVPGIFSWVSLFPGGKKAAPSLLLVLPEPTLRRLGVRSICMNLLVLSFSNGYGEKQGAPAGSS